MKQIITKTINWHSVTEEGFPKVNGNYFIKVKYGSFGNGDNNIIKFSVEPVTVITSFRTIEEVIDNTWCYDDEEPVWVKKGNIFYYEDDDERSYTEGEYFPVNDVTHWANTETDCMETVEFID